MSDVLLSCYLPSGALLNFDLLSDVLLFCYLLSGALFNFDLRLMYYFHVFCCLVHY